MKIQKMYFTFCRFIPEFGRLINYRYVADWPSKLKEMRKLAEADAIKYGTPITFYYGGGKKIIQPR